MQGLPQKQPHAKSTPLNTNRKGIPKYEYVRIFDEMNLLLAWKKALETQGAAGFSGLSVDYMWILFGKKMLGDVSLNLKKKSMSCRKDGS